MKAILLVGNYFVGYKALPVVVVLVEVLVALYHASWLLLFDMTCESESIFFVTLTMNIITSSKLLSNNY